MSGHFDADWLQLREAADHAARPDTLLHAVGCWANGKDALRILDLGAGTGSNPRYLAPALACAQHWTLVDHDRRLLALADRSLSSLCNADGRPVPVITRQLGLADPAALIVDAPNLVTASALLDLVSDSWLADLASACRRANAAVLFALSYDGDMRWESEDAMDEAVRHAVNAHQRRDKGLGPALGPDAARRAAAVFAEAGYTVQLQPSPWLLGPESASLQGALLDGWLRAAMEQEQAHAPDFLDWAVRRHNCIRYSEAHVVVGHQDLFAIPAAPT
ncbi:MAG: class I SAM-dependent methyltransferase [Aquisalimonadaceae bacterium]